MLKKPCSETCASLAHLDLSFSEIGAKGAGRLAGMLGQYIMAMRGAGSDPIFIETLSFVFSAGSIVSI